MKYHLHINQERAIELGLNLNQAHILDLLCSASTWAEPSVTNGEVYYWVARQKVCSELPLLALKPDTVYRHLKKLAELGVIEYIKDGKKDLIKVSEKGKGYYVGNKSEKTRKQIRENSEINPTDPITIDTTTKDNTPIPPERESVPLDEIKLLYNQILSDVLPECLKLTDKRKKQIRACWNDDKKHQSLEFWRWYFELVKTSDFLTGKKTGFRADLDFLTNKNKMYRVIEGAYQ